MKPLVPLTLVLLLSLHGHAQYADQGIGNLRNQVWWFDWAGFTVQEGASRTFTTSDGLSVNITFTNVSAHTPVPYPMNTWPGSLLWLLYNFTNPAIKPALYDPQSTLNFTYTLNITATRNGQPAPFSLVAGDAEASQSGETTTLQTNGSNWQSIQFYRNSAQNDNPLSGCGTSTIAISNTYGGNVFTPSQTGQSPVIMTQSPSTGPLIIQTTSDHAGTLGGMALAFGIFDPEDRGDLPLSNYGAAYHQLLYTAVNSCSFNPPYPDIVQNTNLYIGLVPGDADPIQYDNDDSIGVDEEGVSSFATYNGSGTYSVNLTVTNTSGATGWLTGWFDYNRNATFDPGESVTIPIANNATNATLTWTGLPQYLPPGSAPGYGFRFRISSVMAAARAATGYAPDGEVEDYFVASAALCAPLSTSISPGQSICSGQPVSLAASGGTIYDWSPATGLSDPNIPDPSATPAATTEYKVTISNPQGCQAPDSTTITVLPIPVIALSGPDSVCGGTSITLMATGATNYAWMANGQTIASGPAITVSPSATTTYFVTGAGANSCTTTDSLEVLFHPPPILAAAAASPTVCLNDSLRLTASGGDQYAWLSPAGAPIGSTPSIVVAPATDGNYIVQITNNFCNLSESFSIPVTVEPPPDIRVGSSNDIDCTHGQATLHATGGISWQWQAAPGLGDLTSANPVVSPPATITYYVKGTDANGCSNIDSVTQKVDFQADPSRYPVASAFTPNNDGHNDCFGLQNWGQISALDFSVFDRLGARVFHTTDPDQCWDGNFNGKPQPAGTYVYQVKANTACGTVYRKGTVILIR